MESIRNLGGSLLRDAALACLVLGVAVALPSAALAGSQKEAPSGKKLAEFEATCKGITSQIDATLTSLNQIVAQASADPQPPYKQFLKDVETMHSMAKKGKANLEEIQKTGAQFFETWQKELGKVTNPEIKALAEERKTQLQAHADNITTSLAAGKEEWQKFLADLKDIDTFLSHDLTPAGINAVKEIIVKVGAEGDAAKSRIGDVLTAVQSYRSELSPTPQPTAGTN